MKKITVIVLSMLLCVSLLAGCGAKSEQPAAPAAEPAAAEPGTALLGGWSAAESYEITAERQDVFDKAMEGLVGVDYAPIAYLASQTVSGTNHAFLCSARVVRPDAKPYYALVCVYQDLQGKAEILDIKAMAPNGELSEDAASAETLAGGWSVPESEEDGLAAFAMASERLLGVDYTPIKVMGEQLVSGKNYCVLCQAKVVSPDAKPYYCLVTVYQKLDGQVEVTQITELAA